MIIKDNAGDWGIVIGRWDKFRKGIPGVTGYRFNYNLLFTDVVTSSLRFALRYVGAVGYWQERRPSCKKNSHQQFPEVLLWETIGGRGQILSDLQKKIGQLNNSRNWTKYFPVREWERLYSIDFDMTSIYSSCLQFSSTYLSYLVIKDAMLTIYFLFVCLFKVNSQQCLKLFKYMRSFKISWHFLKVSKCICEVRYFQSRLIPHIVAQRQIAAAIRNLSICRNTTTI